MEHTKEHHPGGILQALRRIQSVTVTGGRVFCVACLLAIVVCTGLSVTFRYVFFLPLNFSDPLSVLFLTWVTFVGTGLAVYSGEHVFVDYFISRCPQTIRDSATVVTTVLISFFLIMISYYGFRFALAMKDSHDPLVFNISLLVPYISVPVGMAYTLVQLWLVAGIALLERRGPTSGPLPGTDEETASVTHEAISL